MGLAVALFRLALSDSGVSKEAAIAVHPFARGRKAAIAVPRHHLKNRPGRMAFTRDGKVLAVAWSRDLVRLVDASNGQELATLTSPDPHRITKLCFSPDDDQLAVATENHVIHLWDLRGLRSQLAELGLDWDSPP
jgi:WD40 repeat protein